MFRTVTLYTTTKFPFVSGAVAVTKSFSMIMNGGTFPQSFVVTVTTFVPYVTVAALNSPRPDVYAPSTVTHSLRFVCPVLTARLNCASSASV